MSLKTLTSYFSDEGDTQTIDSVPPNELLDN